MWVKVEGAAECEEEGVVKGEMKGVGEGAVEGEAHGSSLQKRPTADISSMYLNLGMSLRKRITVAGSRFQRQKMVAHFWSKHVVMKRLFGSDGPKQPNTRKLKAPGS